MRRQRAHVKGRTSVRPYGWFWDFFMPKDIKIYQDEINAPFRQGAYNPGSRGGQELLAHELTHVVQQSSGAVQRASAAKRHSPISKTETLYSLAEDETVTNAKGKGIEEKAEEGIIQAVFGVRSIDFDPVAETVTQLEIPTDDRPPTSLTNGEQGDHTTAWVTIIEGFCRQLIGKTYSHALTRISELTNDLENLPGWSNSPMLQK